MMAITLCREGDEYVAVDSEVGTFGFGATEAEACAELAADTAELHQRLRELGPGRLGHQMAAILARLGEGEE